MLNVETNVMAPWNGSGVAVSGNAQEVMKAAGLDWLVEGRPLFTTMGSPDNVASMAIIPTHKAIARATDDAILGIVGKDWNILQNHEVFQFVDEIQNMGLVKYSAAGSFKGGRLIWVQAEFAESEILPGDVHKKYLVFTNAFDGTFSVRIGWSDIRIVCMNTFMMASKEAGKNGMTIRHTSGMRDKIEEARSALILAESASRQYGMFQRALTRMTMTPDMWTRFGETVVPPPAAGKRATRSDNARDSMLSLAFSGRGQDIPGVAGTGYAALNALTEYVNYERMSRGNNDSDRQSNRFQSAMMGSGHQLIQTGVDVLNEFLVERGIQVA